MNRLSYGLMQAFLFQPIKDPMVMALSAEIARRRDFGEVVVHACHVSGAEKATGTEIAELLDAFVEQQGCLGLREDWTRLSRDEARVLLVRILARDLAYNASIMPADRAQQLAQRFLDLFPAESRFFSNTVVSDQDGDLTNTRSGLWSPITNAAFDTGVIALGGGRIAMLWVKDED